MSYEWTAPIKDPASVLDHAIDWTDWLDEGETITGTPAMVAAPEGLTLGAATVAAGVVNYRVRDGVEGQEYIVTCRITTNAGRIDERSVRYLVGNR